MFACTCCTEPAFFSASVWLVHLFFTHCHKRSASVHCKITWNPSGHLCVPGFYAASSLSYMKAAMTKIHPSAHKSSTPSWHQISHLWAQSSSPWVKTRHRLYHQIPRQPELSPRDVNEHVVKADKMKALKSVWMKFWDSAPEHGLDGIRSSLTLNSFYHLICLL